MTEHLPSSASTDHSATPFRVAAIGEVLWDIFPTGARFGGAPANFASTLAAIGGGQTHVSMVSCVGEDDLGRRAIETLQHHGVDTTWVALCPQPTGQVLIELDASGRATYEFASDTAWDNLRWSEALAKFAGQLNAVCFGTLGQRSATSAETIQRFIRTTPSEALRVFDINLRPPFYNTKTIVDSLKLANVLKLNDEELPLLAEICGLSGSAEDIVKALAAKFTLRAIALTRGESGALLIRGDKVNSHPGIVTDLVDTVGAGDAFTAVFMLGLLRNVELETINRMACDVAAFVCSQSGATPEPPDRLRSLFSA